MQWDFYGSFWSQDNLFSLRLWFPAGPLHWGEKLKEEKQKAEETEKGEWLTSGGKEKESVWLYQETCEN